jgi:hypothetical protein
VRKLVTFALAALGGLVIAGPAAAADPTLEGTATAESGHVKLVSDFSDEPNTANNFGSIVFAMPAGTTVSDIETLSAEFNVTDDDCGGGSPRFTIVTASGNVFVHFGPAPSFTGCPQNTWLATGNLVTNPDARVDAGQVGGSASTTYSAMLAVAGNLAVTQVRLDVDGGWSQADKEQTVLVRNVVVDGVIATPTGMNPAQTCRALRASMGEEAFRNTYGTNPNKRNAFGKCVSQTARMKAGERRAVAVAAVACKAEGKRGRAVGACVAAKSGKAVKAKPNRGKGRRK